jgi:hypothetical protein
MWFKSLVFQMQKKEMPKHQENIIVLQSWLFNINMHI